MTYEGSQEHRPFIHYVRTLLFDSSILIQSSNFMLKNMLSTPRHVMCLILLA